MSHTNSNTLTLCPLWTTELSQTSSASPILSHQQTQAAAGREISMTAVPILDSSLETSFPSLETLLRVVFLSIREAMFLTKVQVISVKYFAHFLSFFSNNNL